MNDSLNRYVLLEDILSEILSPFTTSYTKEAIECYERGSYRAAIILTWIAVCIDIVEKIQELSSEDNEAKQIKDELNKIKNKQNAMSFEKGILDFAQKLSLITEKEGEHLHRLYDDRNSCAHPTLYQEDQISFSSELVRYHIIQSANILFTKPAVRGKHIVDELNKLIQSQSFPDDCEKAVTVLSGKNYLKNVRPVVIRNLCILQIKTLFNENIPHVKYERNTAALFAIHKLYPNIFNEVCKEKLDIFLSKTDDSKLKQLFLTLNYIPELWNYISASVQQRIKTLLDSFNVKEFAQYNIPQTSDKIVFFHDYLINFYNTKIEGNTFPEELKTWYPCFCLKELLIKRFCESGCFDEANKVGACLINYINDFGSDDMQKILDVIPDNSQVIGAYVLEEILRKIRTVIEEKIFSKKGWNDFCDKTHLVYLEKFI